MVAGGLRLSPPGRERRGKGVRRRRGGGVGVSRMCTAQGSPWSTSCAAARRRGCIRDRAWRGGGGQQVPGGLCSSWDTTSAMVHRDGSPVTAPQHLMRKTNKQRLPVCRVSIAGRHHTIGGVILNMVICN